MATMATTVPIICPMCGARVQCRIKDDTGGVPIIDGDREAVVVLTVNTTTMKRHIEENHV